MTKKSLWDPRKSATLSIVVTCVGMALAVACYPFLFRIVRRTLMPSVFPDDSVMRVTAILYVCLTVGVVALIVLLFLLRDIRRGDVFTSINVARLRLISYCGFAIMIAAGVGGFFTDPTLFFAFVAIVAGFLGLLMRVIKNVIEAARLLKEDADYTI